MAVVGGRAHSIAAVHAVGRLGYPFAEISLKSPEEVESQLDELLRLKSEYGLFYLAHFPNEDNPFDPQVLKDTFLPRMYRLLDLAEALGIPKGTIHFWIDRRWAPPDLIPRKIELLADMTVYAKARGVVLCIENLPHSCLSKVISIGLRICTCMTTMAAHPCMTTCTCRWAPAVWITRRSSAPCA